ncbi:MAG: polyprenyl synthetase family protein [Herbinix sp.]|nr:polyprenyl synthetase family protein [Herbinix sp.]
MTNNMNIQNNNEVFTYEEAIDLVKKEVERSLTKSPLIIREYLTHLSRSQGKFIRAVSVITCAEDKECKIHPSAVLVAAAIEILHLASLVHDDVIDNADIRRGKATLQKKYGKRTAVICGDYLLSLALKKITDISNRKDYLEIGLPDYIAKLCLGELNQHINNRNLNLSIFQYLKIISGKTAALFEASFYAGAVIAGCTQKEAKKYRLLGNYIGMIFQLSDDCIDFDTTVEEANKPVQSDYEQGVITLPLIHALQENENFKEKAANAGVTREEINEEVTRTEGLTFTKMIIQKYHNKAMQRLGELELAECKKARLVSILNKASRIAEVQ